MSNKLTPGWFKEQVALAESDIEKWPEWMKRSYQEASEQPVDMSLVKALRQKIEKITYHSSQFLMHERGAATAGICNRLAGEAEDILSAIEGQSATKRESGVDIKAGADAIESWSLIGIRNGNKAVIYNSQSVAKAVAKAWGKESDDALRSELAAYRTVFDAANDLNKLMNEVDTNSAGQNDRVFAHFEFDQLRYAIGLVENLKGMATNEIEGETTC